MTEPSPQTTPDRRQLLRYAEDLSRLHAEASKGRQLLARVVDMSLELTRCVSSEELAVHLARIARDVGGWTAAGVYVLRDGRFQLLATHPEETALQRVLDVRAQDLLQLGGRLTRPEGASWRAVAGTGGAPVLALPLLGRQRSCLGCLVGVAEQSGAAAGSYTPESALALLGSHAGTLLENFRFEERRSSKGVERADAREPAERPSGGLLGDSPAMKGLAATIQRLARVDSSVLIRGETGTGKTRVARAIHETSQRASGPFVSVNCGAIPDALLESELFGHEAGAFTGAQKRHRGRIEQASGGTLFLDEVGELSTSAQAKLLTVLEERRLTRVGGESDVRVDVRILAATNRDLEAASEAGTFRRDLLFRLDVVPLHIPPLRERGKDALLIARSVAAEVATRYGLPAARFEPEAELRIQTYPWPGNVRELRNVIERAVVLAPDDGVIAAAMLPAAPASAQRAASAELPPLPESTPEAEPPGEEGGEGAAGADGPSFAEAKDGMVQRWEEDYLRRLLTRTRGNVARAAREAKMDKKHLQRKIEQHGIDLAVYRNGARGEVETDA